MDYKNLLDAETWSFVRRTNAFYPEDAIDADAVTLRKYYDALCAEFEGDSPADVEVRDSYVDGTPVRTYTAGGPTRTILFFHGGGFVVGGLNSHNSICAELCAQTGYRVISVDYRLSPEFSHPAAFEDCYSVTDWALETYPDGVVLVGDSAGGCLAASVAHHARGRLHGILGQVLIYPVLGGDTGAGSYLEHTQAPLLTRQEIDYYQQLRCNGPRPTSDPTFEPLQDSNFADLPPTVMFTADCDPVRDDSRDYLKRITKAGGRAFWVNEDGLVHGFLRARHSVPKAQDSFERITIAIEALGQGIWPYD
jgi:acetyl esterase/lipase